MDPNLWKKYVDLEARLEFNLWSQIFVLNEYVF